MKRSSQQILTGRNHKIRRLSAPTRERGRRAHPATGFTLVEMLVAVGLVVLMMTLFAQIFQMTTGTMATQKGLSENDQRVRMVATLLRGDLKNRTMKEVGPFASGESTGDANANWDRRLGYFYIGENDHNDGLDDVLQLTAQVAVTDDPYTGAARVLLPDGTNRFGPGNPTVNVPPGGNPPPLAAQGIYWQNQPEFDDQLVGFPDFVSSSHMAEVSYFVRNGTLYRRVMLIREPSVSQTAQGVDDHSPTNWVPGGGAPTNLSTAIYQAPTTAADARNFYTDFDFSAFLFGSTVQFHGADDLDPNNSVTSSLLNPSRRFGHDPATGLPREHVNQWVDATGTVQTGVRFIGRFTHEETSYINPGSGSSPYDLFGYPGMNLGPGTRVPNPYQFNWLVPTHADNTQLTYDPTTGKVREYAGGNRIAEDVLLTNVKRFDIKVWDETAACDPANNRFGVDGAPGIFQVDDDGNGVVDDAPEVGWDGSDDGAFADVGHGGTGYYSSTALTNVDYCPLIPGKATTTGSPEPRFYRFDTWHPTLGTQPPFRAPNRTVPDPVTGLRRVLRAIQIKITFLDPQSQQVRDITINQSLYPPAP
jgi:type II secretory pathway pseudopilin PulG